MASNLPELPLTLPTTDSEETRPFIYHVATTCWPRVASQGPRLWLSDPWGPAGAPRQGSLQCRLARCETGRLVQSEGGGSRGRGLKGGNSSSETWPPGLDWFPLVREFGGLMSKIGNEGIGLEGEEGAVWTPERRLRA